MPGATLAAMLTVKVMTTDPEAGMVKVPDAGLVSPGAGLTVAGRVAPPFDGFYSATKFGIEGLSEALHYEVGHFGIRVVMIEPGGFETSFGANEAVFGREGGPYDELAKQWEASRDKLPANAASAGPETVAAAIADAIEAKEHRLRHPVGADAELVTTVRAQLDDATFESTMRETLGLTW